MLSFVDLDNTLFDTLRLQEDSVVLLQKDLGISREEYYKALEQVFPTNNNLYSFQVHAKLLAVVANRNEDEITNYFTDMYANEDSAKYVFPDATNFLKYCRSLGAAVILSFGTNDVQKPRIEKSGLLELVDDAIVTQGKKSEEIGKYMQGHSISNQILFIDDSMKHLEDVRDAYPDALTIHMAKNSSVQDSAPHARVNSLMEAQSLLATITL